MTTASISPRIESRSPQGEFVNEPFADFKNPQNAQSMKAALNLVAGQLGREYDLIIGGRRLKTESKIRSLNPARPAQVVGIHQKAGAEHAKEAMQAALGAFASWSRTSADERASLLLNAA
jgi:1-pyrroline-5-carboxylate dehydrogenase